MEKHYVDVYLDSGGLSFAFRVVATPEMMQDCKAILGIDGNNIRETFANLIAVQIIEEAKKSGLPFLGSSINWRYKAEKILTLNNAKPRLPTLEEIEAALEED